MINEKTYNAYVYDIIEFHWLILHRKYKNLKKS